jgi:hypothetical protein
LIHINRRLILESIFDAAASAGQRMPFKVGQATPCVGEERIYAAGNALAKADLRILIASSIDAPPSGDRLEAFRPLSPLQPKSVLSGSRRRGLSEYLLAVGGGGLRTR